MYKTLPNPPIQEAVIQIKVAPSDLFTSECFKDFIDAISNDYPLNTPQQETIFEFIAQENSPSANVRKEGISGYKLMSSDELNIVQISQDRIAISRLSPYDSWERLYKDSMSLWAIYRKLFKPKKITGLSIRYINQFDLPKEMTSFEEYLNSSPVIPEGLPQGIGSFYTTYRLPNHSSGVVANVQLIYEGVKVKRDNNEVSVPIVLDTDVYQIAEIEENEMDSVFQEMHDYKNDIFFRTLTKKAVEMFK